MSYLGSMADDVSVSAPVPSGSDPSGQPQKNPLDVLEELLNDAKAGAQAPAGVAPAAPDQSATPLAAPEPAGPTPEQLAQMEAEREAQDQAEAQAKLNEIQSVQSTPEFQARIQQDQAAVQQKAQETTAQDGFEIIQLDHTKIP